MNTLKFSVVTPSLNQGEFIEDNIKSVLNQDYDNVEHIILDGGSTDNTLSVLKKYKHLIWISEPDKGQSDAANKGFKKATGDIICWVNSDDMLVNGALHTANQFFKEYPDELGVTGARENIDRQAKILNVTPERPYTYYGLLNENHNISQMATFFRRDIFEMIGYLDETLHYAMDYDFFLRFTQKKPISAINNILAKFRIHNLSKTSSSTVAFLHELRKVRNNYNGKLWCPVNRQIWQHIIICSIKDMLARRL